MGFGTKIAIVVREDLATLAETQRRVFSVRRTRRILP
jgi:hypothetical protein